MLNIIKNDDRGKRGEEDQELRSGVNEGGIPGGEAACALNVKEGEFLKLEEGAVV